MEFEHLHQEALAPPCINAETRGLEGADVVLLQLASVPATFLTGSTWPFNRAAGVLAPLMLPEYFRWPNDVGDTESALINTESLCTCRVGKGFPNRMLVAGLMFASLLLAGCGTSAAKNFGGSWKPVNQFPDTPTQIPLNPAYIFYASPMDETLKTMLARWAKDSDRNLVYRLSSDITLYKRVSDIHTTDIASAANQLSAVYAAQNVFVTVNGRQILVEPASKAESAGSLGPRSSIPAQVTELR